MVLSRIEQPISFKQQAYEEVKNAIINHLIAPGDIIFERNLSENLGISRTPLREAIQLLEMEGWIKSIPRKGILVCNISERDVEEVLHLRKANEVLVMELVIPNITHEEIQKIEEIYLAQSNQKQDNKTFISLDKDFHIYMAELSGNKRLAQLMQTLSDQVRWFGVRALNLPGRIEQTLQEHAAIIEAIKSRDFKKAREAVLNHIEQTRVAVLNNLQIKR